LKSLFEGAGLASVETRSIDISLTYEDFEDYWNSNTGFGPFGVLIKGWKKDKQQHLKLLVQAKLRADSNGKITDSARANAVRGRV
jgi:hypothetical protein